MRQIVNKASPGKLKEDNFVSVHLSHCLLSCAELILLYKIIERPVVKVRALDQDEVLS